MVLAVPAFGVGRQAFGREAARHFLNAELFFRQQHAFVSWGCERAGAGSALPALFFHGRGGFADAARNREYTARRIGRHRRSRSLAQTILYKLLEILCSTYHVTYDVS
ncbi:hypothetical protein D3C72_2256170 [compost metagenome]